MLALVATMLAGATSAAAMPLDEVPADPDDWATSPYSPLPPEAIAVPGNTVELTFTGEEGGLHGAGDVDTGFTMIQPSSADGVYYLPENLAVGAGALEITTTNGIAHAAPGGATGDVNKQDNTLGVGFDPTDGAVRLSTTFNSPNGIYGSAQGGLWFGPDDDNYVKLAVLGSGSASNTGPRQIQLSRETGGAVPNATNDQRTITTTQQAMGSGPITLNLDVNTVAGTITGTYQVADGPMLSVGTLPLVESLVDGSLMVTDVPGATTFGGVFATKRNMPAATPVVYSFNSFSMTELDHTPPDAPTGLAATADPSGVSLSWDSSDPASDVVGFRVFRGTSTPVATTGDGLGGTAPLTLPQFDDDATFIGGTYHYAVVAVDAAGNVSEAAVAEATVPGIEAEPVAKINFQTDEVDAPDGYTADLGLAYTEERGHGWLNASTGAAMDNSANARLRTGAGITDDLRLATIIHLDIPNGSVPEAMWQYDLPNGTYTVVAAVGDGANYDSTHVVRGEETVIVDGFVGTSARQFDEAVATIEVTDGALTIDQTGGNNTKIAYIEIYAEDGVAPAPAAPTGVTAVAAAPGVLVQWTGSDGAEGYHLLRAADVESLDPQSPLTEEPVTAEEYLDETAAPGETYVYAVVAVNAAGTSPASETVSIEVPVEATAPAAPTDLSGAVTDDGVELTWAESEGAVSYHVYRSESEDDVTEGEPIATVEEASYLDETTEPGTSYFYAVVAFNEVGASDAEVVQVSVPAAEPEAPGAPVRPSGTLGDGQITVSWEPAPGATGYHVHRGIDAPAQATDEPLTGTTPIEGTSFADDELQPGATYYYLVVAVNDGGSTPAADQVVVEIPGDPQACAPGQWVGEFFTGRDLAGPAVATECVDELDHTWGTGGPEGAGINNFSARWTTTLDEGAGVYEFQARADDAVRVIVDGDVVLERWTPASMRHVVTGTVTLSPGPHTVEVEYYEATGAAGIQVDWFKLAGPDGPELCDPGQWSGEYFAGRELSGPVLLRECVDEVHKDWGSGGPEGVGINDFSARWTTTLNEGAGTYEFQARADDGVRVLVDDEVVLERWTPASRKEILTGSITLEDGSHTLVVEYFEARGAAGVEVDWFKLEEPGEPQQCPAGQWAAEYFDGRELSGPVLLRECVDEVNESWGTGGPDGAGINNFSARWTTTMSEGAGTYEFQARADDGVRVIVDGDVVLERWTPASMRHVITAEVELDDGPHTVVVEYYEATGAAGVEVDWFKLDGPEEPQLCAPGEWSGEYFGGRELAGAVLLRECVDEVNKDWGSGGPEGVGINNFSARWTTTINEGAGTYEFQARADDAVRVFVDGEVVVERWTPASRKHVLTGEVELGAGQHTIVVEYYEATGAAGVEVSYTRTGAPDIVPPAPPTLLTATATTAVDLSWQPSVSPDTVGYRVYRSLEPDVVAAGPPYSGADLVSGTAFFDPSVDRGQTYYYVVTAVDGAGNESVASAELAVTIEQILPPTDVVASADDDAIELSWTASVTADVTGYHVYRATESDVGTDGELLTGDAPATGEGFTDSSAVVGQTYYYVVTALDDAGNESAASNEAVGAIPQAPDTEAPEAPSALTATGGDGIVELTWEASTSEDTIGYHVYRDLESGVDLSEEPVSGAAPIADTEYTDTAVTNGTTYHYVVTAVDGAGNESDASPEALAVPNPVNDVDIKIDFASAAATPADGYLLDFGEAFGPRTGPHQGEGLTYGWTNPDGNPVSLVGNGRVRGRAGIDPKLDSIIHMQYGDIVGTNGVDIEGTWELALPNGLYDVTVAVGDQGDTTNGYDSEHALNIEAGVGIELFQGAASAEYHVATVTVGVWDGALTIDPRGGTNTKLAYVEVVGTPLAPHVDTVLPDNRDTGHDVTAGVSATIRVPFAGAGVDPTTLQGNVHLYELPAGVQIPVQVGTSGGNDVISLTPVAAALKANTTYRFVVTDGVQDTRGTAFVPFSSLFTTGSGDIGGGNDEFTPLTGIEFEKVELPIGANKYWSSFTFGPDGKMYGTTIGQGLWRFTVNEDGTLSDLESLGQSGYAMIGLVFDESSTADDLRLWVTKTSPNVGFESEKWVSGISLLTGPNLETEHEIFDNLPRSQSDHLTNSLAYGPDGRLYVLQGSNQAAGDLDVPWGQRGETLLTAAALVFDPAHPEIAAAAGGAGPIDVKTAEGGTYDPFAEDAPLKIYATGIRNAYDLVWHSNGHLYVPTNGTAGGANSPGVTVNSDGTFTRTAAAGIPGFSTVNGKDVTDACLNHRIDGQPYSGGDVPPINNHPTQSDHLYRVEAGGYYGHPNPERCEWVLHEGNDPSWPRVPGSPATKYPVGTKVDPNYRGIAWDLGFNKSPNGALEYQSETFGGQLKGRLVITRFSNNNDLTFLQVDSSSGEVLGEQTSVGITGVPGSTMTGVDGFNDPLEVVEDPNTGNLYVNQYNRGGSDQKLFLLRVPEEHRAATLTTSSDELIFSAVKSTTSGTKTVTVTNASDEGVVLQASIGGANSGDFTLGSPASVPLAAGASTQVAVAFSPGSTVGQRSAVLELTADGRATSVGLYGLSMNGIEGGNEPPLQDVMGTLGFGIDVGWTNLAGGMQPSAKGQEVLEPLFVKSGNQPVTMTPVAHYAPKEDLPFGWYTGDGTESERNVIAQIDTSGYQSLLPPITPGGSTNFDPGDAEFGLFYFSNHFSRYGFTEDRLNSPAADAHRARIYPARDRSGTLIANSYIVAFEDASNGDYQDYVFLVTGVRPASDAPPPVEEAIRINFSNLSAALPDGYLRDYGQPFGARTAADQGSGLSYGWKAEITEAPIDLTVGGTTGPGNGRDRNTSQTDQRLDTLMHMQPTDIAGTFSGVKADAFWELAVPNGKYEVTVAAGDSSPGSDPESHVINVEGTLAVGPFVPSGAAGSNTRHQTATVEVTVADGLLTVDADGGTNAKINYIDVVPLDATPGEPDDPSDGAAVKINFQTTEAPTPAGWMADTGAAFTDEQGYGWLVDDTPTARTASMRYRTGPTAGISYVNDLLLQTFTILDNNQVTSLTEGTWEYELPNGTYKVAVAVGDSGYLDSTHTVLAEGQPVINNFVPNGTTPHQTGVRTVEVTDGRLTITSGGHNTKLAWVAIDGEGIGGEEPPPPVETVQVDFGPADAQLDQGWIREAGEAYSSTRGFGWFDADTGQPVDRTIATRDRTSPTSGIAYPALNAQKTFAFLDNATQTYTNGTWQYDVPNGTYDVEVSVGDAGYLDSTHGLAVEGQPVVTAFVPTGTLPFSVQTVSVEVTDGALTLTNTGTNTKVNYVKITGEELLQPTIGVTVAGLPVTDSYSGGPGPIAVTASAPSDSTIESLTYTVDDGDPVTYEEPFTLPIGTHTVTFTATDSEDRTTSREITFEILDVGGTVQLTNEQVTRSGGQPIAGMSDDWVTLHRINSGVTTHEVIDSATVTVTNTGEKDLRIADISIAGTHAGQFELGDLPDAPIVVEPGDSLPLDVTFTASSGSKGIRSAQVVITSSAVDSPVTTIQLRGGYMTAPEGGNELSLNQIAALFGWTTDIGNLKNGDEMRTSPLNGDEVRSLLWQRADTTKPVVVRQIAAFHGCCGQTETINIAGTSATHNAAYGQSILPLNNPLTGPTQLSVNPTNTFGIVVSGQTTNNPNYMAVKTWPVIDQDGDPVAGAWIVGHDYIGSPNQCGIGATNCDFQDNVYLITNVFPVTPHSTTAPEAPGGVTAEVVDDTVVLDWTASGDPDVIGYRVERALAPGGPWTSLTGQMPIPGTTFTDGSPPAVASGYYRVLAVNYSGTASTDAEVLEVELPEVDEAPIRINAGGGAVTTSGGVQWLADTMFTGGKSYTNPSVTSIAGTDDDALYFHERSATTNLGSFGYDIDVAGGEYLVRLHFAEIYHGAPGGGTGGTGKRVFSVNLEGGPAEITDLDLNAVVEPMTAHVVEVPITVLDGNLDIDFTASVDQPKISAIEVLPAG